MRVCVSLKRCPWSRQVPSRYYQLCLGKRLKYSCAYYPTSKLVSASGGVLRACSRMLPRRAEDTTLDEAEEAMLNLYVERAELKDGGPCIHAQPTLAYLFCVLGAHDQQPKGQKLKLPSFKTTEGEVIPP